MSPNLSRSNLRRCPALHAFAAGAVAIVLTAAGPARAEVITGLVAGPGVGNGLVFFDSANPGSVSAPLAITGVLANETLIGIDYRPTTGTLYAIGNLNRLYTRSIGHRGGAERHRPQFGAEQHLRRPRRHVLRHRLQPGARPRRQPVAANHQQHEPESACQRECGSGRPGQRRYVDHAVAARHRRLGLHQQRHRPGHRHHLVRHLVGRQCARARDECERRHLRHGGCARLRPGVVRRLRHFQNVQAGYAGVILDGSAGSFLYGIDYLSPDGTNANRGTLLGAIGLPNGFNLTGMAVAGPTAPIPEPASALLGAIGLAAVAGWARGRRLIALARKTTRHGSS